jgi:hypothetical protein
MRKSTIVAAVLCAAGAFVAGARADSSRNPGPIPAPTPAPGPVDPQTATTLQAQVTALQTRVTALETYVLKAKSACTQFDLDVHTQAVGFKCITKKGKWFELVSRNGFVEAWKGPDGTIWSDELIGYSSTNAVEGLSFDDAKKKCSDLQASLPSPQDLYQVYANGFSEVDPAASINPSLGSAPIAHYGGWWTSMTSTGSASVGPAPGKLVQQVGDQIWSYGWPATGGWWMQTTPYYDILLNKNDVVLENTRCVSR